jgi:prepilin-type N-terminal cleavage/methylation domain-containing protein
MKNTYIYIGIRQHGFSLAEVLAALIIGSMVLVAMLNVYSRASNSAQSIEQRLDNTGQLNEVLQRITEDLDTITSSSDVKITFENKIKNGYPAATLTILKNYKDTNNQEHIFDRIIWVSSYDYKNSAGGLVLYRSHDGVGLEDKILDKNKSQLERQLFVPICSGITYFKITAPVSNQTVDRWDGVPTAGITVTISFTSPIKQTDGTLDVPPEKKITRTIAIDRTRKINLFIENAKPLNFGQSRGQANPPPAATSTTGIK